METHMKEVRTAAVAALSLFGVCRMQAAVPVDVSPDRVPTPLKVDLARVGTLAPRSTRETTSQPWMLGCETLDRDFTDFEQYKDYLEPLGIKRIRLQCGWAKCEKEKGKYDFAWLDRTVDFAAARGIACVLETDYGNPLHGNGKAFHKWTDAQWTAWENWVRALATHFKGRVRDFLMWNEPDTGRAQSTPEVIARQNVRTAKVIKSVIPDARIGAFGYAGCKPAKFEASVVALGADADLFTWVVYHGYVPNPDAGQGVPKAWGAILAKHAPKLKLFQGEQGAPSKRLTGYALKDHDWTEWSQAKWDLRRYVGDIGNGAESSVFTIADICYFDKKVHNAKGLLATDLQCRVVGVKKAYYAVQNMVSVFDDTLVLRRPSPFATAASNTSVYAWARATDGARVLAFWDDQGASASPKNRKVFPTESFETRDIALEGAGAAFRDPVWVDLISGRVYAFPPDRMRVADGRVTFTRVPCYDAPCLLAERRLLRLQ